MQPTAMIKMFDLFSNFLWTVFETSMKKPRDVRVKPIKNRKLPITEPPALADNISKLYSLKNK